MSEQSTSREQDMSYSCPEAICPNPAPTSASSVWQAISRIPVGIIGGKPFLIFADRAIPVERLLEILPQADGSFLIRTVSYFSTDTGVAWIIQPPAPQPV